MRQSGLGWYRPSVEVPETLLVRLAVYLFNLAVYLFKVTIFSSLQYVTKVKP